jgi:hypothetical protein
VVGGVVSRSAHDTPHRPAGGGREKQDEAERYATHVRLFTASAKPWQRESSGGIGAGVAQRATRAAAEPLEAAHAGACANCGAVLQGAYCHVCGQPAHSHKKAIGHLAWEAIEGLFHLDGRLAATLPALFLRPGRLARDYMEGRIARHVPPFRMFLVALLLFIFAAEYATHHAAAELEREKAAREAALATPPGRAAEAARIRKDAAESRAEDLREAAQTRAEDLRDRDETAARVQARFARQGQAAERRYAASLAHADRVAKGLPEPPAVAPDRPASPRDELKTAIKKATANPEFFWMLVFAWGHRLAVVLLPIVGLALALVYRKRRGLVLYDHLLVAMDLMSFSFFANAPALLLPAPYVFWWLGAVALWTPINLFQTLRGGYGSSSLGAALKTLIVWIASVTAFCLLLAVLMVVAVAQFR